MLPKGGGEQQRLEQAFDIPVGLAEVAGEPVEQFRMAGQFSLRAEVVARFDEARAEQLLPEAIDGDAGSERMLGRDEPVGEVEPGGATAFNRQFREDRGDARLDGVARFIVLAAKHHERIVRFGQIFEDHAGRHGLLRDRLGGLRRERSRLSAGETLFGRRLLAGQINVGQVEGPQFGDEVGGGILGGAFLVNGAEFAGDISQLFPDR